MIRMLMDIINRNVESENVKIRVRFNFSKMIHQGWATRSTFFTLDHLKQF